MLTLKTKVATDQIPRRHRLIMILALMTILAGGYVLFLTMSPRLEFVDSPYILSDKEIPTAQVERQDENYILIPKIGLMVPFYVGDQSVLQKGAWHRFPERGDPVKGGNFILSAHRFQMGLTPTRTKQKSPFFTLNKVAVGDEIDIRFEEQDYKYKVTRIYTVKPEATEIEQVTRTPRLTLYTCTLKGSADGRTVVEAVLR